jgi:macrolide transport system ATP-binding/permease protein
MAFHPDQIEAELRGRGVGAEEAHFAVMRQFGNSPRIKERSHEEMRFWLGIVT